MKMIMKCQWSVAAFPLLVVACGGSGSSDNQGGGGVSSGGVGGSNVAGMPPSGGASNTAGSAGIGNHGGSSGDAGTAGSSAGHSSGGSLGTGGSAAGTGGSGGMTEKPTGFVGSCFGRKCPIQICDNQRLWSDTPCSDVYDGPVGASTNFCAPDGTGNYCLELTDQPNSLLSKGLFAINCTADVASIVRCQGGCGYRANDPTECN